MTPKDNRPHKKAFYDEGFRGDSTLCITKDINLYFFMIFDLSANPLISILGSPYT